MLRYPKKPPKRMVRDQVKPFLNNFVKHMHKEKEIPELMKQCLDEYIDEVQKELEKYSNSQSNVLSGSNTRRIPWESRNYNINFCKKAQAPLTGPQKLEYLYALKSLLKEFLLMEDLSDPAREERAIVLCVIPNICEKWIYTTD